MSDGAPRERPPSVDSLARSLASTGLPHPLCVDAARKAIANGRPDDARVEAETLARALLRPVVNATGVLLHTNLGRAPFASTGVASYTNLELDLQTGRRGSRHAHAGALLARLCGAESAIVVNNGAAAVMLVLAALASGRDVVVSRGELVEIGGGFRVPDVMEQSGARLAEVGTTNRTRLADYERALADPNLDAALVMQVHRSNYRIVGFTESVSTAQLGSLSALLVCDLGSGLLDTACPWLPGGPPAWLHGEPAAKQTLADGAALVTFSGDKLLGGPQAGVIAGRADLVAACASHPLARALRPGSLVLGAMQQLALTYLRRDGMAIPFWRMASISVDDLRARAKALEVGDPVDTAAVAGGGTLPGIEIPSAGVSIEGDHSEALRAANPPIIARVHDDTTTLDLRAVDLADDQHVAATLRSIV